MFTKKDIKTGMWVEFACGDIGLALEVNEDVYLIDVERKTCISRLGFNYAQDLSHPQKAYSIEKVWAPSENCNYLLTEGQRGQLLFDRGTEAKKKELITQIETLQKELKELDK